MRIEYYPESSHEVMSNQWLSDLILELRYKVDVVDSGEIKHACYMVGLTIVNNMQVPYWRERNEFTIWKRLTNKWKKEDTAEWDRYLSSTSGFALAKGKDFAINQLLEMRAEDSAISVELFMRSFEVILREYVREFDAETKAKIVKHLQPLISYAKAA